ncbi:MAG TPA: DUF1345 domain-containing protein [Allosphingosinicella sp.]|nr:DUF1345 domain-containing protein [Allosphingosinicella sp.]
MAAKTLGIGNRIAPPHFIVFIVLLIVGDAAGVWLLGLRHGLMAGFDVAAGVFLLSLIPVFFRSDPPSMRSQVERNDANRVLLLGVTGAVVAVILVTVAAELIDQKAAEGGWTKALVIATLVLAWLFSNTVYALHYAHMYYRRDKGGKDRGGIDFPGTPEPDYSDFIYFAFTLGMTFQTSDSNITSGGMRSVVVFHCFAGFVYNIGVLAFTINVLGGSH